MHILVVNDDGPPSPHASPYVHSLVRELQGAGHVVSVCLPHTQRSWIGKAHMIGQTVKPLYYRPPPPPSPPAGLRLPDPSSTTAGAQTTQQQQQQQPGEGSTHARPHRRRAGEGEVEEWVLVDGTPASCVQIGLYHYFAERGPVDLVVSGPNYGRNTTAVFALSSGTLGGALEAAVCRRRAVALSYAFFDRNHDPAIVAGATRHAVRVIGALARDWPRDSSVDLYSVNVPLVDGVDRGRTLWTAMLQNYWDEGSCFSEVEGSVGGGDEEEERIREKGEGLGGGAEGGGGGGADGDDDAGEGLSHKRFKWAPRFVDVYRSVDEAPPGNDGWAVKEGHTSVTPLKANFWHAATHLHQKELQLDSPEKKGEEATDPTPIPSDSPDEGRSTETKSATTDVAVREGTTNSLYALVAYEDSYVQPMILSALRSLLPNGITFLDPPADSADMMMDLASLVPGGADARVLQIAAYEAIDFGYAASHAPTCLVSSYVIRKALIRKHFLSATVDQWAAKRPGSALAARVKRSEAFEVDYAEFLDDALVEAFDLRASLERNEGGGAPASREWWILKPGMSDRGQGIKLFSTMEQLQGIFDAWEAEEPPSEDDDDEVHTDDETEHETRQDDDEDRGASSNNGDDGGREYITISHLRHFVAQPYIHPPLLLPGGGESKRKFHIRTYVASVGSMKVYVYRPMLALFAAKAYQPPWETEDAEAHLTNTCAQGPRAKEGSVRNFWDLELGDGGRGTRSPSGVTAKEAIFAQICQVTGELFEAAARGMTVHFQPLPNAFEVFGLDFLVDAEGTAWLLEVNAFPDFKQTGEGLRGIVAGFWAGVLRLALGHFLGRDARLGGGDGDDTMVLVRDVDLGRRLTPAS